jgi:long-subunit fatty acid transport protein
VVNAGARAGDIEAAESLPGLSQDLLRVAAEFARSRQELDRVQAQTAAALEQTYAGLGNAPAAAMSTSDTIAAAAQAPAATPTPANDELIAEVRALRMRWRSCARRTTTVTRRTPRNGKTARIPDRAASYAGGDMIGVSVSMTR